MKTRETNVADMGTNTNNPHSTTTMAHSQLVFSDRGPYLWLTHIIPRASHCFIGPALLATRLALSIATLVPVVSFPLTYLEVQIR